MLYLAGGFVLGEVVTLLSIEAAVILAMIFMAGAVLLRRKTGRAGIYLLLPVLFFSGVLRSVYILKPLPLEEHEGKMVHVTGRISDITRKAEGYSVITRNNLVSHEGKELNEKYLELYFKTDDFEKVYGTTWKIGYEIYTEGKLSRFNEARNPGEFDYALYNRSLKRNYRIFVKKADIIKKSSYPYRNLLYKVKCHSSDIIDKIASSEDGGILKAAILGDKSQMNTMAKELYQKNGIAHLLAISGLHISMIGMSIYSLLKFCKADIKVAAAVSSLFILSYGIMTGGSTSAMRAVIMLLIKLFADIAGRTYDLLSAASVALILLLADSPYYVFQGGFQLSFGAVIAVGIVKELINRRNCDMPAWKQTLCIGSAIQVITCPVILYHFYQYPFYGIFLNFLIIPFMAYVILSGISGIILGSFSTGAGIMAVGISHYILYLYQHICGIVSSLPWYTLVFGRPSLYRIILYYMIWCIIILKTGKLNRKLLPLVVLCVLFFIPLPVNGLSITFLDVGQGDGIIMQSKSSVIMVDGGSTDKKNLGESTLEPFIKSRGISRIDYIFVSHADKDHISGIEYILKESEDISIGNIMLPCLGEEDAAYDTIKALSKKRGCRIYNVKKGDEFTFDKLKITCIYPAESDFAGDRNEQSQVLKVSYGGFHMLLTGDMSSNGEKKIVDRWRNDLEFIREIQVLKAAHHGSGTATGEEFLDFLKPQWVILSYGINNSYGHPDKEVVKRLRSRGINILRTAEMGAVTLNTDGKRLWWEMFITGTNARDY